MDFEDICPQEFSTGLQEDGGVTILPLKEIPRPGAKCFALLLYWASLTAPSMPRLLSSHTSEVPLARHIQEPHPQFPFRQYASCLRSPFAIAFSKWGRCSHSTQQSAKSLTEENNFRSFALHYKKACGCLLAAEVAKDATCDPFWSHCLHRGWERVGCLPGAHRACGPGKDSCPN